MSRNKPPLWLTVLILFVGLPLILPFLYVAMRSWQVGAARAYELLFRPRMWDLLGNTLLLMFGVTLISIVLGIACALLFQRYRFFGKTFFQTAITLPLCIPAFVSCFTWISLTFRVEGFWGTVMIMSLSSFPLAYLPVEAALKRISLSFEEVSLSLGKSRLQTFFSAILPQLKPAIGSSILLIALHMLIEFGAVSILNYPTFTTAIFQEYEMSFDNNTAALLSAVLMAVCGIVVFGESIFRGKTKLYHSGKGVARPYPVKTMKLPAQICTVFFLGSLLVLSIVIPFGILIRWMMVGSSGTFELVSVFDAFARSMGVSAAGALLTILCALPLVWASIRYRNLLTVWIDRLPFLLHAVPGLVIALSLIYFSINYAPSVYQTFIVVVLAYFMLYLPMAQTTLRTSLEQFPKGMEQVGATLGRGHFFIFRTLVLPSILPGITAAFALVFLNLMKELTATLLLTADDVHTLSTAVWEYTSDAQYAAATPYALMLVLFSGLPVFILKKYAFK
ncbi:ABC transporter permease [Neisseria basseii]|uniref:ABC transporter permease n=1 Tax=Neisseria basseii TaxID=2830650 RepID=UPI00265B691C|nr:iron ABC transporter permease [Neisseria basseii]